MKIKNFLQTIWSKIIGKPIAEELGFTCCFCNESITSLDPNPSDINIIANINKPKDQQADQFFYCHLQCLKNKLHHNIKEHFVLDDINKQKPH